VRAGSFAGLVLLLTAAAASAQPYPRSDVPRRGSIELGGSVTWSLGYDAGDRDATETPNSSTGAPPLTLFTTTSTVKDAIGADARVGVFVSNRVSVEGLFQYSRPVLEASIADDFENAAPIVASDQLSIYTFGGSVLYHFGSGGVVPFVAGGAGYMRQVHEGNSDVLTGTEFHGGGGLEIWMGEGARRFGLRIDAQVSSRDKSIAFEDKRRIVPVLGFGASYLF